VLVAGRSPAETKAVRNCMACKRSDPLACGIRVGTVGYSLSGRLRPREAHGGQVGAQEGGINRLTV
jgi:hypothetical protein